MKNTLTFVFIITTCFIQAQTDQANQYKYWKYREMLKSKFVKIGKDDGCSIPMACRIPGYAFGGTLDPSGTQLQWKDATITLGYYLVVLATEYKLLSNANENTDATLNKLYYSIHEL